MARIICVSNRVSLPDPKTGKIMAGGLAVGVLAALQANGGGVWLGWNGDVSARGSRKREVAQTSQDGITFLTLPLTTKEYEDYYKAMANQNLWPLMHELDAHIEEKPGCYKTYRQVNRLFAQLLKPQLKKSDIIWVHDYHLVPLGHELRALGVENPLGFFMHTPMPGRTFLDSGKVSPELRRQYQNLLKDLFYYDVVGFQSFRDFRNFCSSLPANVPLLNRYETVPVTYNGRRTYCGVFPISVETGRLARLSGQMAGLGLKLAQEKQTHKILIGAERLDYTKGLVRRIQGYGELLAQYPEYHDKVKYYQITPLSRRDIRQYKDTIRRTRQTVKNIMDKYGHENWQPLIYSEEGVRREELLCAMRHSHVGLVTPLIDGQNLVAKEYLAAQNPEDPGVLVLSERAGAAEELKRLGVFCVDPYNQADLVDKINQAIQLPRFQRCQLYSRAIAHLYKNDIAHWAQSFLDELRHIRMQPRGLPPFVEQPPGFVLDDIRHKRRLK